MRSAAGQRSWSGDHHPVLVHFLPDRHRLPRPGAGEHLLGHRDHLGDAINNPLAGFISDRTRTRWGRRRPYLLFGAIPFRLFFILLWWILPIQGQPFLFAYYLVTYILFETTATFVHCPYAALTPELTQDHDERTSLVMCQMVVTILAGVLVPVLFGLVVLPAHWGKSRLTVTACVKNSIRNHHHKIKKPDDAARVLPA